MKAEYEKEFLHQLPTLLQLLSDPFVTPHTTAELWCRVKAFGWESCKSILQTALRLGESSVQRLVLDIISEEARQIGSEEVEFFLPDIVTCLKDADRLVRNAAVLTVRDLEIADDDVIRTLRQIVIADEPIIAHEAFIVLIKLDKSMVGEIISHLRLYQSPL